MVLFSALQRRSLTPVAAGANTTGRFLGVGDLSLGLCFVGPISLQDSQRGWRHATGIFGPSRAGERVRRAQVVKS